MRRLLTIALLLAAPSAWAQGDFIRYYPPASSGSGASYVGTNSFFIGTGGPTSTGQGNILIGDSAGANIASGGVENVIVGWLAGDAITTGDYNTALGAGALSAVQTGTGNVGIGGNALQDYTGDYAVAIGYLSFTDATGNYNIGIGRNTGLGVTTGQQNVVIGTSALSAACTTCSYNMAIGTSALGVGLSQDHNVAIGYNAGLNNDTDNNVFIGSSSGTTCASGTQNTLIGQGSDCAAATSDRIIAIGEGAKAANFSIAIGREVVESDTSEITIQALAGTRFSTDSVQAGKSKALVDNTATAFVRIAIAQTAGSNFAAGEVKFTIFCKDASNQAVQWGNVGFACHNLAGTETCTFDTVEEVAHGDGTAALSAPTFDIAAGTDTVDLRATSDCTGVTPSTQTIYYHVQMQTVRTVTPL